MAEILKELDLALNTYSIAPIWNDDQPYYGLFIESSDIPSPDVAVILANRMEEKLRALGADIERIR